MSRLRLIAIAAAVAVGGAFMYSVHARLAAIESALQSGSLAGASNGRTTNTARPRPTIDIISLRNAITKGDKKAPVALVEYSDFQCSFCKGYAEVTMPRIVENFVRTGRVLLVMKQFPLAAKHPLASAAAEAAICAHRQGLFWPMHEKMVSGAPQLQDKNLIEWGMAVGVQRQLFDACVTNRDTAVQVEADTIEARALGFTGTPAFVIGTLQQDGVRVDQRVFGSQPYETFVGAISKVLKDSQ